MTLPAIRNLDAFPVQHEGETLICLRDPEGYFEDQLVLTPHAYFVGTLLDGSHDITDIQYEFARQFNGAIVHAQDIYKVIDLLDQNGALFTETFEKLRRKVIDDFRGQEIRPPYLSGKSYPRDPKKLAKFLNHFFSGKDGPGEIDRNLNNNNKTVSGLIAPHIDFNRGGISYAHAYAHFYKQGRPKKVFIFGVAHASPPVPFVLTKKSFNTPYGTLATDIEIVKHLASLINWDPYEHEIMHRTEHSIEFQTVMLAHLFGPDIQIIPILCGRFPQEEKGGEPAKKETSQFLKACHDVVKASKGTISVIAGADLAHVGQRFGDSFKINDTIVNQVAERDKEDLEKASSVDADGFYASVMKDQNSRRVCGLNCIYSALKTLEGLISHGKLLHYAYAHDPSGGIVSFASLLYT